MPKQTFYYGSRRDFLKKSSLAAAVMAVPYFGGRVRGANDRINIACIGCGGKGDSDSSSAFGLGGNIVALVDVDANTLTRKDNQCKERATKESRTYDAKTY